MIAIPNRKNLIFAKRSESQEDWATRQRAQGVGGSEVATLFQLNDFTTEIELFYNKVKLIKPMPDNVATYSGRVMEDIIAKKYFVFYNPEDPTEETMLRNIASNTEIRNIERFNQVMQMRDYPIVLNVDRLVIDRYAPDGAVVEIKNLLSWVVRQYEAEILPSHQIQIQTYMLGTGFRKAYLVYLLDGRQLRVYEFEASNAIQGAIVERAEAFWKKVVAAREVWNDPMMAADDKLLRLYKMEPPIQVDGNKSLKEFMNLRFKEEGKKGKMVVNEEITGFMEEYRKFRGIEGEASKTKEKFGNHLRSVMLANQVDEITNMDGKVIGSNRESSKKAGSFTLRISKGAGEKDDDQQSE